MFRSAQIGIHKTFDLIFLSNLGLTLIHAFGWINALIETDKK